MRKYISIVVAYEPEIVNLKAICANLLAEDVVVLVYDNSDVNKLELNGVSAVLQDIGVNVIGGQGNVGLSNAFNEATRFAENQWSEIEGFLFFDQDSKVSSFSVRNLLCGYESVLLNQVELGVLGATPVRKSGDAYQLRKNQKAAPAGYSSVDIVISSFSFVPYRVFKSVGRFDEKFFIDLVDSEFSYRCSRLGYMLLLDNSVHFEHEVGMADGRLFGGRKFSISSPVRNYYQIRNLILVAIKFRWPLYLVRHFPKRCVQVLYSGIFYGKFLVRMKYALQGLFDGVMNRGGKYEKFHD